MPEYNSIMEQARLVILIGLLISL